MNSTPPGEQRLLEAVIRVERMGADIGEIKNSIKEMASAITRLAIFEERQTHDRLEIARVTRGLDLHDARIVTLELAQPLQRQTTDWVGKAIWLIVGAVIMAILALVVVARGPDVISRTSTKTTTEIQK